MKKNNTGRWPGAIDAADLPAEARTFVQVDYRDLSEEARKEIAETEKWRKAMREKQAREWQVRYWRRAVARERRGSLLWLLCSARYWRARLHR